MLTKADLQLTTMHYIDLGIQVVKLWKTIFLQVLIQYINTIILDLLVNFKVSIFFKDILRSLKDRKFV